MLCRPESFSITLKGAMNPAMYHPSWFYTIGQLSKEDAAAAVRSGGLHVTPDLSTMRAPLFDVAASRGKWQIRTRDAGRGRARILQVALKTFDDVPPETRLERFGFKFAFSVEAGHAANVAFLGTLTRDFVQARSDLEVTTTILSTTSAEPARRRKVRLRSAPGADRAQLTFSFSYPVPDERMFALRHTSVAENYDLDYEEAVAQAEQLAYKLNNGGRQGNGDIAIRGN